MVIFKGVINMKKQFLILSLSIILGLSAFAADWDYSSGENSPNYWEGICQTGKNQAPIDIKDAISVKKMPVIAFNYSDKTTSYVDNNGHTIQFTLKSPEKIKIGDRDFDLVQLHFHSPSENTINSKFFPVEMHLVHRDNVGNIAVVAIMFKNGNANKALAELWQDLPQKAGAKIKIEKTINLNDLLPSNHTYYRFNGSLTVPPCDEGVIWVVMKTPMTLSEAQLKTFNELYKGNNRPIQPLNARLVLEN